MPSKKKVTKVVNNKPKLESNRETTKKELRNAFLAVTIGLMIGLASYISYNYMLTTADINAMSAGERNGGKPAKKMEKVDGIKPPATPPPRKATPAPVKKSTPAPKINPKPSPSSLSKPAGTCRIEIIGGVSQRVCDPAPADPLQVPNK